MVFFFVASALWAGDGTWTNQAGGAWSGTANWQGGAVASGAGSAAYFPNLAGPVLITNDAASLKLQGVVLYGGAYTLYGQPLTFEGATAVPYGISVSSGAHTVSSPLNLNRNIQVVTEPGSTVTTWGRLDYLGNNTVVKRGGGEWAFSGTCAETNSAAYLDVVGGTLRLKPGAVFTKLGGNRENFRVGYGSNLPGTAVVERAAMTIDGFVLGYNTGGPGYLLIDGGTFAANTTDEGNPVLVGRDALGVFAVSNGAVASVANWLDVGVYNRGELYVGGSSALTAGKLSLGWKDVVAAHNGPTVVEVASGRLSVNTEFVWGASSVAARTNRVAVGNGQPGAAVLSLPATMESAGNLAWARLALDGGAVEFAGVRNTSFGESATNYLKGLDQLWVGRAGATFNTGTNAVTLLQAVERDPSVPRDGGILKTGAGALTLGGGYTYNGPTVVAQGSLCFKLAPPTNDVVVSAGATLSLADGQCRTFDPASLTIGADGEAGLAIELGAGGASDVLAISAGDQVGSLRFYPVSASGSQNVLAGDYVAATYAGAAPVISSWAVAVPAGLAATFELQPAQKRVVMHIARAATGSSVWVSPAGGAWDTADNWNTAPANGPSTQVLVGDALGEPAQISLATPVTLGSLTFDSPFACSLGGAGMTFGATAASGALAVQQGAHTLASALTVPANLAVTVQPGASVLMGGSVTGAGRVTVTGGGTLSVSNGAAFNVPLTMDGGVLGVPQSTTFGSALEIGLGGATLAPAAGKTATFSGSVSGSGALNKAGASIAVLSGPNSNAGARTVQNGTLTLSSLTDGGDLVIGEGTLKYVGPSVTTDKGLTLRTSDPKKGAALETDANVTFNGAVKADSGVFIKAGKGTVTFAASGTNTIGTGVGSDNYSILLNRGAYGESPTQGLRVFMVLDGKVVLGAPGQANIINNTVVVGGRTTTAAGAETAGSLEVNDGFVQCGVITLGRGNGTAVTAPTGLVSTVRINGGTVSSGGLYMGLLLADMAAGTCNARPRFEMNGGVFTGSQLLLGNGVSPVQPALYFNGGFAAITGGAAGDVRLAYDGGVTSLTVVAGGTLAISNAVIRLADTNATAKAVVRLNGGRLITRGFERLGSGIGELYFNGGLLTLCQSFALTNLTAAVVQAGGLTAEVPQGLTLTLSQTLAHDAALGATPDGGLVKLGAGALAINGDQTYTGPTVVSGGVLRVRGTLAVTNLTLSGGATLSLTNGAHQLFAPAAFAAGDASGAARVELDVAADGSAYDVLALPVGAGVKLALSLYKTGTSVRFSRPGRYPLVTFGGGAPDTSSWTVEGSSGTVSFETQGSTVYVRVGTASPSLSVWTNAVGGAWATAGNWSTAPAADASATVLFGSAISAPAVIATGSGVTFGYLSADSAKAYTWSGGAMTLGSAESNATVHVALGAHVANADWAVPSAATVLADPGASLTMNGAVTGAGSLLVTGGGTLALTNGPAVDVPVTVSGATLAMPQSTEFGASFTVGSGGTVFAPAAGCTVTVSSAVAGPGGLTKTGSSVLSLAGGTTFGGELAVRNGTVAMSREPGETLVLGEGTFRYTGESASFARGYTVRTTAATQAATLFSDADLTFNGPVTAESGAFIKLGGGTFTYAGAGENILSAGDNIGSGGACLNVQPYGDTPTQGYRSYNIYNGKVVLGAEGQTNRFSQAVVIGGESTTNADAETAGHLVIDGGVNLFQDYITIGRGNGTAVTAPTGLVSTLTVNGGETTATGFWMAAMLGDETTLTARPLFTMNAGTLRTPLFRCGNVGGLPKPRIVVNGGTLVVGPNEAFRLAYSAGCESELTISGGQVVLTNQTLCLADNVTGAKGTLNLDGGRLIAQNIYQGGTAGVGVVYFNGGVFQPSASQTLNSGFLTNRAGGAVFDVPAGVTYTLARALVHDDALGATPDGGLVKLGEGALVLTNAQAYTGPTVLSNGTLVAAAPAGEALACGELSLGSASGPEAALALTADRARFEAAGAVAVSGNLFLGKTAVSLVVRETGAAPATNGVYTVAACTGSISGSASDLRLANGLFGKSYSFSAAGGELRLTVATAEAGAAVWTNPGGGSWSEGANWAAAPGAGAAGLGIGFMDAIAAPATVTLDSPATAGSLFFNNANSYTLAGAGGLALDETNGAPAVTALLGAHTVAVPLALAEDTAAAVAAGAELQLAGDVSGAAKLTKTGDGRLLLAGTNTYSGGTDVLKGYLDVAGASAAGSGPLTFNGGHIAAKGAAGATVANSATVLQSMQMVTYSPLTLSGGWTASGNIYLAKMSTNELVVAGSLKPSAGSANRLELREGAVRFASGADALFTSSATRECIDFRAPASTSVSRSLAVEPGATVSTRMLYMGYGATNTLTVSGGTLALTGFSGAYYDAFIMGAAGTSAKVFDRFFVTGGTVTGADSAWCLMGVDKGKTLLDIADGAVSLGAVSMGHRTENNNDTGLAAASDVFVRGGLLEARQRWNWMGDTQGPRVNAVYLNGGRLRLPPTFAGVTNKVNQPRLIFGGGRLETPGGGADAEDPADYLKGLKQAYVAAGGARVDTLGRNVGLSQRLMTLDAATDGGVTKLGLGTLSLAKPPCVTGRIDVQAGVLRLQPEPATAYPDDPLLRLSFEGGIQKDDSPYGRAISLAGSLGSLSLTNGVNGTNALHLGGQNVLFADYSADLANADSFTVSAWVRQSAYQADTTQHRTFFGNLMGGNKSHEFVLRIESGTFRMLGTGAANYTYGAFTADVADALPLNTWVMLTYVVDGLNGFSMYVNGEKRTMKVTVNGTNVYATAYGAGSPWLLQPPARVSGRAFMIGSVAEYDTTGFVGDLEDVTVYRRALSAPEMAMLYRAKNPCAKRARVAVGAAMDLAGGAQELAEVSGEGQVCNGTALVTGAVSPGDESWSAAGALLSAANLTLGTNATYRCDWAPAANDAVDVWGLLTVSGAGTIDLGLTEPSQMPGYPRLRSFPVMYYTGITGAGNFSQWRVTGIGRSAKASVSATNGVVAVNLEVFSGTLFMMR